MSAMAEIPTDEPCSDGEPRSEDGGTSQGLLQRHRGGDLVAFAELVAEYRAPVYSYLIRCGIPPGDRDDLFQEIFFGLHASAERFDAGRPLHPWLFTIVANAVRKYHRQRRVRELLFLPLSNSQVADRADDSSRVDRDAAAPAGRAEARKTVAWLEVEIPNLPLAQREALLLVCVEGMPQKQAAEVLGLPLNTVKTHLRRARLALAAKLARARAGRRDEVGS